jgi:hypothetical protein
MPCAKQITKIGDALFRGQCWRHQTLRAQFGAQMNQFREDSFNPTKLSYLFSHSLKIGFAYCLDLVAGQAVIVGKL